MKNVARISVLILSASLAPTIWAQDLPAGEGRDTLKKVCTQCHDIDSIPRLRYTRSDWANLVFSMKDMGADATGAEVVDAARRGTNHGIAALADIVWSIGPHLHFADFISRLTFFWGVLPLTPFLYASMYLCGVLLLGSLIALRLWKYRNS